MKKMTLVSHMPDKDVILKLLGNPYPESQLYAMSSTELHGLSSGIDSLAVVFRSEHRQLSGLMQLSERVKNAENYVDLMNNLDGFLAQRNK